MRAMATAAQGIDSAARLGQRAGAAAIAGASRAQMLAQTLTGAGRTPALAGATASGGGPGGGSSAGPGSPGGGRGKNRAVTGAGQPPPPHSSATYEVPGPRWETGGFKLGRAEPLVSGQRRIISDSFIAGMSRSRFNGFTSPF